MPVRLLVLEDVAVVDRVWLGVLDSDPVTVPLIVGDTDGLAPAVKDDVGELVSDGV